MELYKKSKGGTIGVEQICSRMRGVKSRYSMKEIKNRNRRASASCKNVYVQSRRHDLNLIQVSFQLEMTRANKYYVDYLLHEQNQENLDDANI